MPPGFVVTTDAYRAFGEEAGIGPSIEKLAADLEQGADAAQIAGQISALFSGGSISVDLGAQITGAYRRLGGNVPGSVRSSATAEDLPEASLAGQ